MTVAPFVLIFFMDGVGLGEADPAVNPLAAARLPRLTGLLGEGWFATRDSITTARATLTPTDATLGMPGRPQSATGQATILTGRNVPRLVGEHYGPKPNQAVATVIRAGTLFHDVVAAGRRAALLTPYPPIYFAAVANGRRLYSAVPLAASDAGLNLMTVDDLRRGRAISPEFTNDAWRSHLGFADMPSLSLIDAGRRIAAVARDYTFSFFEHWPSDRLGHRGTLAEAVAHAERLDTVLGALIDAWPGAAGWLIVTSDHGNLESKASRRHTNNPVPTIVVGPDHGRRAAQIATLADIAPVVRDMLGLPARPAAGRVAGDAPGAGSTAHAQD